jgi:DNA-binding XRE family transcriptional regulator
MAQSNRQSLSTLVILAQHALGMTQASFGELLGVSRATIVRWAGGGFSALIPSQTATLVRAVFPVDADLAAQIAAAHETLESLGIAVPPVTPPVKPVPVAHLIDSVVCAAADAVGQLPSALRPSLLAAFERASAVGLSIDAVVKGLKARS